MPVSTPTRSRLLQTARSTASAGRATNQEGRIAGTSCSTMAPANLALGVSVLKKLWARAAATKDRAARATADGLKKLAARRRLSASGGGLKRRIRLNGC